jgi:type VI secretion system protein ImpH
VKRTLGEGLVVGRRIFDEQGKFRVHVGPLTFAEFRSLLPGEPLFRRLVALTRLYTGPEFEFDLALSLKSDEVPLCTMGARAENSCRLGRYGWVAARRSPEDQSVVFRVPGA